MKGSAFIQQAFKGSSIKFVRQTLNLGATFGLLHMLEGAYSRSLV